MTCLSVCICVQWEIGENLFLPASRSAGRRNTKGEGERDTVEEGSAQRLRQFRQQRSSYLANGRLLVRSEMERGKGIGERGSTAEGKDRLLKLYQLRKLGVEKKLSIGEKPSQSLIRVHV